MILDELDRRLLNIVQSSFPVSAEPYKVLAEQMATTEEEIMNRINKLKEEGIIRRVGGVFDSRKLGYKSSLCAMKVPVDKLKEAEEIINSYPGVTHNYLREHDYNMWFTLISPSEEAMEETLDEMRAKSGCEIRNLPATRFFKIKVDFKLKN
ncbi:Lrp/AsnC family transcriptional regulator [Heliorestis acidaminivorans]|uniref:siroheme decarboxylase n=1 Tax=Heliorestis acidaminivorans TaxID=553427 RepID=A0A6I0EUZ1_9FIRM|nr:AsnC family transcriptional regulator [Heliorestis acidaminivorans]KAB2954595.1 Lrp/AsnC family transcriptional regulator [Heliorestis acidaminivorans]